MKQYLIDGNNVVCFWRKVQQPELSDAAEFAALVRRYVRGGDRATIVFDGPPRAIPSDAKVLVRFSMHERADAVLIRMIEDAVHPERLVVVSDDAQIRQAAGRCRQMGAAEFLSALNDPSLSPEKPDRLSPLETQRWLKEFGLEEGDKPKRRRP